MKNEYKDVTQGDIEATLNKLGGVPGMRAFLRDELVVSKRLAEALLEFVGVANIAATTTKFVVKEKFELKKDGGICSYLGDNLTSWFLNGDGKTEDPISEQTLRYHKLRKSSRDLAIVTELGGEEKAETTLMEMFSLMESQKNGEAGHLLINGYANIFYIRDQNGVLRAVLVAWRGDGWRVNATELESPIAWNDGRQVFSRN